MTISFLHAVWTVLLFAVFMGIAVWVYLGRNKTRFEEAANIPFDEGEDARGVGLNRNRQDD